MSKKMSRFLAMLLAATMTLNTLPLAAMATNPESPETPVVTETVTHPEGAVLNEDGTYTYPDGSLHNADGTLVVVEEEESYTHPEDAVLNEDGTYTYPDGSLHNADGTLVVVEEETYTHPEDAVLNEDGTYTYTDGKIYNADGTLVVVEEETYTHPEDAVLNEDGTYTYADGSIHDAEGNVVHPEDAELIAEGVLLYADGTYHDEETGELIDMSGVAQLSENVLDAAIFCSDVHGSTSDLTSVLKGVATSDVDYSSIGFVGDTALTVAKTESAVNSGLGYTPKVMFSYAASHDTENSADISTNWNYSGEVEGVSDYYLVYTIRETDMQNNTTAEADFTTWYSGLTDAQKTLPIFIMSHRPLHARRNDNANAADWYKVISAAAESSDITFFWAHNHTGETSVDTAAYYVAKDGTESFTVYNGDTVVPNFTYMNAGYINANNQDPARINVATTVQVTADSLIFQDYTTSGTYTDSSYSHNVTVAREFAVEEEEVTPTLSSISVSDREQTMYIAGQDLEDITVTAIYSDSSFKEVTDYTTTFDSNKIGKQTVTVSYGGKSATFDVVVAYNIDLVEVALEDWDDATSLDDLLVKLTYNCAMTSSVAAAAEVGDVEISDDGETVIEYVATNDTRVDLTGELSGTVVVTAKDYDDTVSATYENGVRISEQTLSFEDAEAGYWFYGTVTTIASAATVTNVAGEVPAVASLIENYAAYTLSLTDYQADAEITAEVTICLSEDMSKDNFVLYYVSDNGTVEQITEYTLGTDADDFTTVTFTTDKVGTFAYGTPLVQIPEGASLTNLAVTGEPETTKYFIGVNEVLDENGNKVLPLDITGLVVTATYSNGTETVTKVIPWNEFDTTADAYSITVDMTQVDNGAGQDVKITYAYGEVTKETSYKIYIYNKTLTDNGTDTTAGTGVSVELTVPGVTSMSVADKSTDTTVTSAVQGLYLKEGFVAYDIKLEGHNNPDTDAGTEGEKVTVTLPIPEGVTNPMVYYVSDDGKTVTNMAAGVNEDGKTVSFTTDHFSTYVIGDGITIETESGNATVEGTEDVTTTIKVATPVTVYKLVTTPVAGNGYLIVNSDTGTGYGLDADTTGYVTTAFTGGEGYYTSWDEASQTGTAFSAGSDVYLTTSGAYLWTTGSNTFTIGYDSDGYGITSDITYTLNPASGTSGSWTLNSNKLSISLLTREGGFWGDDSYTTYYLTNSGSAWSMSTSGSNVYFYEPVTVYTLTDQTTTIPGTEGGAYSTVGTDIADVIAVSGKTVDLTSTLYWTPEGGETTTVDATGVAVTYEVVTTKGNPDVITSISGNTATLSGTVGTAVVKVTYTYGNLVAWDEFIVTTTEPNYTIDLHKQTTDENGNPAAGEEITDVVAIKGITEGQTYSVWAIIKYYDGTTEDGEDLGDIDDKLIEWSSSDTSIATVDPSTGIITFTGKEGTVNITATYLEGNKPSDTITISVTQSQYSVPADGTSDFPEYPNEGAIRFDKTATAVGNFSETGIAQVELSMTGVPYTTGSEIDVVVMLDMTGSMSTNGMTAAEEATVAFVEKIVKNTDGSYNENRVAVYAFNSGSSSPYELVSLKKITSDDELTTANTAIRTASDKQASGGTPFDESAKTCYEVLAAAKTDGTGNNRQQFCVFMSDGGPTTYYGVDKKTYYGGNNNSGDVLLTSCMTGYTSSDSADWSFTLPKEYYTEAMKADGVTVYTVGLLLQTAPSNPAPYSSMTDSTYDSTTDSLTTIGSHYYFTSSILKQMASDETKYIDIFNVDNASKATAAFESIAKSILQAATNVTVEDQITDEYTMIFDIPTGSKTITGVTNDFYIEFVKYTLDENHERTTETSVTKLYLKNTDGVYSAASDSSGTAYDDPVFAQETIGDKGSLYYWTTDATMAGKAAVTYTSGSTTYYFIPYGQEANEDGTAPTGWYNMTSGGYASGTVDSTTNMSTNLVIATPYFVYNAATRMLYWTVDKLDTYEYALRYFLYLDKSATEVGTENELDAGSYPTNDHAYITYTNFKGNDCQEKFPVPQLTWNGAQVSYVFYLVNAAGQPINKSGQLVDFANATFITDVYTTSVVWNKELNEGTGELSADWLADELLPADYVIYDEKAGYELHVYQNADGSTIKNQFTIEGDTAANISSSLNTRLNLDTTESTVSTVTTKVYNTKAGEKITGYGTYYSSDTDMAGFDFANTTVAFAVVWEKKLVPDTVVVDFGLDVLINVVQNDTLQNTISGIGLSKDVYGDTAMNTGVATESKLGTAALTTAQGHTVSIENENLIRFHQNDMTFVEPDVFYYETSAEYWQDSEKKVGYMYSSVTVVPATTIYYEDEFVTFIDSSAADDTYGKWEQAGTTIDATQDQDRPGKSLISEALDADNLYGYDSAYTECAEYSLGSAMKVTVNTDTGKNTTIAPTATFTFKGTGFDVISLTDSTTGLLVCQVKDSTGTLVGTWPMDTYYGYAYDETNGWQIVDSNNPNALYQIPVIKSSHYEDLTYDTYTVTLYAAYSSYNDHVGDGSYDLYIDAIRIYDPAGENDEANNAYVADSEGWPAYTELRDLVITANTFDTLGNGSVSGVVFIDGATSSGAGNLDNTGSADDAVDNKKPAISDYINYGPKNELYLASGQAIAFELNAGTWGTDGVTLDTSNIASVQIAMKSVNGDVSYKMWNVDENNAAVNTKSGTIKTSTDLYYDITDLNDGVVVISNSGSNILSITNIKVTFNTKTNSDLDLSAMLTASTDTAEMAVLSLRSMLASNSANSGSTGATEDSGSSDNSGNTGDEEDSDSSGSTGSDDESSDSTGSDSTEDSTDGETTSSGTVTEGESSGEDTSEEESKEDETTEEESKEETEETPSEDEESKEETEDSTESEDSGEESTEEESDTEVLNLWNRILNAIKNLLAGLLALLKL